MKKGLTELVFILDKSGSMSGLEADTIGGYNSMLSKQQAMEGECRITTVLFDNDSRLLHDRIDLKAVSAMTDKEYAVGGSTALLDAIGRTIRKIGNVQKHTAEGFRAEKVLFVIITDGEENASREYSADRIREMIRRQKEEYGWEFIFLGANIDSAETAESFGIGRDMAADYNADSEGTRLNYEVISQTVSDIRARRSISKEWKERINEDRERRGER